MMDIAVRRKLSSGECYCICLALRRKMDVEVVGRNAGPAVPASLKFMQVSAGISVFMQEELEFRVAIVAALQRIPSWSEGNI